MVAPKMLLFYYLMSYETKRRDTLLAMSNSLQNVNNQTNYTKSHLANLDTLFNFSYFSTQIFDFIPINYMLARAKEPDFFIVYPSLLRLVINLFTQLCQVEHCLYESRFIKNTKWMNLDFLLKQLSDMKASLCTNELNRNRAHMFKRTWLKAYSIHGRK